MNTIRIAFYKARHGNWQDYAVSAGTLSKYSHCEIVFSDGECASSSSRDGGVRFKQINLREHWDIYTINTTMKEESIRYWFYIHSGDKYDWPGAIVSVVGLDCSSEDKKYCSYACAAALGIDPVITPGGLYKKLKKSGTINNV